MENFNYKIGRKPGDVEKYIGTIGLDEKQKIYNINTLFQKKDRSKNQKQNGLCTIS